jgi:hypothetical protein
MHFLAPLRDIFPAESIHRPPPRHQLHNDDSDGAQNQNVYKAALMKNHADGPDENHYDSNQPEHHLTSLLSS